jgi:hypothetical protein
MPATKIISNDELYNKYPSAHAFALDNFDAITEENYVAVESWEVADEEPVTAIVRPIFADWYEN